MKAAMAGRFRVAGAKAAAVPVGAAAAAAAEESIASIAALDPLPIRPVTTRGRIVFLCGAQERYPQVKTLGLIGVLVWT